MNQAAVTTLVLSTMLLISSCERFDTIERTYPDMATAISAGAIEKGWIPTFLPMSAKDIRLQANLDTNEVWLGFSVQTKDQSFLEKSCRKINKTAVKLPRNRAGDWWPMELRQGSDLFNTTLVLYSCQNNSSLAAKDQKFYFWRYD